MHCTVGAGCDPARAGGPVTLDPAATVGQLERWRAQGAAARAALLGDGGGGGGARAPPGDDEAALVGRVFDGRGFEVLYLTYEALRAHEHLWARAATFIGRSAADAARARDVTRKWAGAAGGMRGAIANYDAVERALEGAGLASLLRASGHRRRGRTRRRTRR